MGSIKKTTKKLCSFSSSLSSPLPPLSFCIVKTRSQQRRSNGRSDEKSRSLRADTERKGRATKIREKEQIKANLHWWSRPYLKSFKEWQRELEIIGQIVWLYTDNLGAPQKGLDNKLHLCLWRYFHISHRLTYSRSVTFHCCCQLEGRLCKTVFHCRFSAFILPSVLTRSPHHWLESSPKPWQSLRRVMQMVSNTHFSTFLLIFLYMVQTLWFSWSEP